MIIVTAGEKYTDIDLLSSAIGYRELLKIKNIESEVVLPGALNETVTNSVLKFGYSYQTKIDPSWHDLQFVIVDVSDPKYFADFVKLDRVLEIYDHHFGFEEYWHKRLGSNSHIEGVGACATLVWERYKAEGMEKEVTPLVANLFVTCIIGHTLNLRASVTSGRDYIALEELKAYSDLPLDWPATYFTEAEKKLLKNPLEAMRNDTKHESIGGLNFAMIQMELWNSRTFLQRHLSLIREELTALREDYAFFTSPSISEGINYIVALDARVKSLLHDVLAVKFDGDIGRTNKLFLRKEIIRKLQQQACSPKPEAGEN